jgi:hypothetical protein
MFAPADDCPHRAVVVRARRRAQRRRTTPAPIARKILDTWLRFDRSAARQVRTVIELGARSNLFLLRLRHRVRCARCSVPRSICRCSARCCCLAAASDMTTLYRASNLDRHLVFIQGARFVLAAR